MKKYVPDSNVQRAVRFIQRGPRTTAEVAKGLGLDVTAARCAVAKAVEQKQVIRIGKEMPPRYEALTPKPANGMTMVEQAKMSARTSIFDTRAFQ